MTTALPSRPSLENLKKQAKTLQKKWRATDAETLSRIRNAHPQFTGMSDEQLRDIEPRLTDCQLVLAREAGFVSWPQLKVAVESAIRELADRFIDLACLCYDDPHFDHRSFHVRAHELLAKNPEVAEANIWAAAAAGNAEAVASFLEDEPALLNQPGPPHHWTPLFCACYSRVKAIDPSHSTYAAAKLLLERGADANTHMIKHNDPPGSDRGRRFTALTGVFGGGSTGLANQPPHPQWRDLAELLLIHGADPADEQALRINQDASLEILLRHGLKPDARGQSGVTLLGWALAQAARHGNVEQMKLLLAHGARLDEKVQGKIPWEHAMRLGQVEVARVLEQAGAIVSELDELGRFVSLCMAGDERGARTMLERNPDLRLRAPKDMVNRAVWTGRASAVKLALDLGFDPNYQEDNPAITQVGVLAENEEILRILLSGGASLTLRDPWYNSTAIGWADFFNHLNLRDRLLNEPGISLFDALDYDRLDRIPDLLRRDPEALNRPFAKCLSREPRAQDWQTPLMRMVERGKADAVQILLEHGADIAARHPDGRSLLRLAKDKNFPEINDLLERHGLRE